MSGQASLRRIRVAAACDPAAIKVILPDWCPLSDDEVLATIDRMAREAGGVPLVLYNPPHAKTRLTPAQFGRLAAEFPPLIGVKVAGGDAAWYAQMRDLAGDLAIFVAGHHHRQRAPPGRERFLLQRGLHDSAWSGLLVPGHCAPIPPRRRNPRPG